jgi:hypothetical protein
MVSKNDLLFVLVGVIVGLLLVLLVDSFKCDCELNVDRFNYYLDNYGEVPYVGGFVNDDTTVGELKAYREELGYFFDVGVKYFGDVCERN